MFTPIVFGLGVLWLCVGCFGKRNWEYEPLSIDVNTSNENKMKIEARIERLGRGEFSLTGSGTFNYDLHNDNTMIEGVAYRSESGSEEDYQVLPWSIPKQTFDAFAASHYEEMIYSNLKNCSNLPQPDKVKPWPRITYKFDKCVVNGDGFPEILAKGYYKLVLSITGEVDWGFVGIVQVTHKNDLVG